MTCYRLIFSMAIVPILLLLQACENKPEPQNVKETMQSSSHFEHLKDLDWLVGNWIDESDNIDITYTNRWEMNKNFLAQYFTLTVSGEDPLKGIQLIGWDPTEGKIRSWIFDSDGGYGETVWSKEENNKWYASVVFTMPNGDKATATHVYSKIDDNTYTFASENRDINGKLLANIGPFKVVRGANANKL